MPGNVGFGVGLIALATYASTLMLSVPGGDAGELIAEACVNGVPHPPVRDPCTRVRECICSRFSSIFRTGLPVTSAYASLCAVDSPGTRVLRGHACQRRICPMRRCGRRPDHRGWPSHCSAIWIEVNGVCVALDRAQRCVLISPTFSAAMGGAVSGLLFALSQLTWEYSVTAEVRARPLSGPICPASLSPTGVRVEQCALRSAATARIAGRGHACRATATALASRRWRSCVWAGAFKSTYQRYAGRFWSRRLMSAERRCPQRCLSCLPCWRCYGTGAAT